ncbi:hypothetical protein RI054_06g33870 [Pseudoscourfieldia marina]
MESSIADTAAATSVVRTAKQVTEEAEACAALAWGGRKLGPTAEKALQHFEYHPVLTDIVHNGETAKRYDGFSAECKHCKWVIRVLQGWVEPGQGEDSLYFGVTVL